jgi:hypothetical protein
MKEIKGWKENFSLVGDDKDNLYVYDHTKFKYLDAKDDDELDVHPVQNNGNINYEVTIKMKKSELEPKWLRLVP